MKILVPIKRVPDYQAKIKIKADGSGIETDGIKWIVNPFDEIAVEEALKLKESGKASEVIVMSVGPRDVILQLQYALAMGADRGIIVVSDDLVDSDLAARVMVEIYKRELPGLVIMGKQAIDSDASQCAQLMAARLGIGQACFASQVKLENGVALVTREVDGGLETLSVQTPCIISTDLRLNTPRYASLPGIMKAKKKPMEEIALSSLAINGGIKVRVKKMALPEARKAGKKVASVAELVKALREDAKVL